MIVVAGFNSAIDKYAETEAVRAGAVNRLASISAHPGGKGVHVAQTCGLLGEPVRLVGIVDAEHAPRFDRVLTSRGVEWRGVPIASAIRSCYAIRDRSGRITEIREPGPHLSAGDVARLERRFVEACRDADLAVLSGSLPRGCAADLYGRLIRRLRALGVAVIVDTSGAALAGAAEAGPSVIKPNVEEAGQLTGAPIADAPSALDAAVALADRGIARVVISLGARGAVAAWDGRRARVAVAPQDGVSAVGSGDCFVGALAVGLRRGDAAADTLRIAAACGAANVLSPEPGFFQMADVRRLVEDVQVEWL